MYLVEKLFQKKLRDICDACLEKENNAIQSIEHYVEGIKDIFVSITQISQGTGIDINRITDLYKRGRLAKIAARVSVNCSICGAEIKGITKKGHFCVKCYDSLSKEKTKTPVKEAEEPPVLRNFDKNIVHTRKTVSPEEKMKFGFKKTLD